MSQDPFPSGVLTFLFSDIQGSTPLWERDPAGMSAALERHNAALYGAIAGQDGRVFKIIGDEFQAVFLHADQAVRAAIAGQRALAETAWGHIGPLRVRMGIHTGAAEWEGHDYAVSHTFNRTARIMSCGHGGQILISGEAMAALGDDLPPGVTLRDMGRLRLKGLTEREHLFQINTPGLAQDFPPLKTVSGTAPPIAHNLPEPATPFIGRQRELAELGQRFASDGARLVTITGAGGMGKTRLALEFAWRRRGQYASGVHFISLAPLSAPDQILPVTANVVGLQFKGDRKPEEQLLRYLRSWQALLIFDNFEHLRQGAGLLTRVLEVAPQVDLLATSRERLGVRSECLFALSGLTLPVIGAGLEQVPVADAVRMFDTHARRVRPDYERQDVDWPAIVQLCHLVEGMPLAIELAVAWTRTLSPAEILAELEEDLQILERESPDVPARQRSMQTSFAYSWRMLSADERQVLMKLSVFRGGCSREAAQEVAGGSARTLGSLIDKSMLRRDPESGRYEMHELLRQLAEERLHEFGLAELTICDHADYFLTVFERAEKQAGDEHGQAVFERLFKDEIDNCRAAMKRSLCASRAEIALRLILILRREGDLLWREEAYWLEHSLQAGGNKIAAPLRAEAQLELARLNLQNHFDGIERGRWIEVGADALALYEELGDERGMADALHTLGFAYFGKDFARASAYYRQAIAIYEKLGEEPFSSWLQLAWANQFEGYINEARQIFAKLMANAEKNAAEMRVAMVRSQLAELDYYEGRLVEAKRELQDVLAFQSSEGRPVSNFIRFLAQGSLLNIALAEGDLQEAERLVYERFAYIKEWDAIGTVIFFFHQVSLWLQQMARDEEAAFWIGCFDAKRDEGDQPVEKIERPRYERLKAELEAALGVEPFRAAYEEGYNTPVDDALEIGLAMVTQASC